MLGHLRAMTPSAAPRHHVGAGTHWWEDLKELQTGRWVENKGGVMTIYKLTNNRYAFFAVSNV